MKNQKTWPCWHFFCDASFSYMKNNVYFVLYVFLCTYNGSPGHWRNTRHKWYDFGRRTYMRYTRETYGPQFHSGVNVEPIMATCNSRQIRFSWFTRLPSEWPTYAFVTIKRWKKNVQNNTIMCEIRVYRRNIRNKIRVIVFNLLHETCSSMFRLYKDMHCNTVPFPSRHHIVINIIMWYRDFHKWTAQWALHSKEGGGHKKNV